MNGEPDTPAAPAAGPSGAPDDNPGDQEERRKPMTPIQAAAAELAQQMANVTNGLTCDVNTALVSLQHKERRAKRPFPWKVSLEIGPSVRVNIVGYIRVTGRNELNFYATNVVYVSHAAHL